LVSKSGNQIALARISALFAIAREGRPLHRLKGTAMKSITTKSGFLIATALLSNVILAGAVAAEPATVGADFSAPVNFRQLTITQVVVSSVTLDLPAPGVVILNSGGYAVFNANPASVACSITKGTNISHQPQVYAQNHNDPNARRMPIATTRGFREADAGLKTYNFVCGANVGSVDLIDIILTGIYTPKRY
jgi:hypothetical protein